MLQTMKFSSAREPLLCKMACSHGFRVAHSSTFHLNAIPVQRPALFRKLSRTVAHLSSRNPPLTRNISHHFNATRSKFVDFLRNQPDIPKNASISGEPQGRGLLLSILGFFALAFPSLAAEAEMEVSGKINIEAVVVAIDNFFNRYPYFVSSVTFIWLVVIPLMQEYLKKYKQISALDAFKKLKDVPNAQLLDIRKKQSLNYLPSPNLKILKKNTVDVEFSEGGEEEFVKEVLKVYQDPGETVICVLDNFGADSLKVAELLVNNGFKEVYAIKDGLRGKDGWQAIQETLLPASVHVYPRKKKSKTATVRIDEEKMTGSDDYNGTPGHTVQIETMLEPNQTSTESATKVSEIKSSERPLSPYPNYEDLKPPSSPSPAKPQ